MTHVYLITGSCPVTQAEVRLEWAEMKDAEGKHDEAEEYRVIVQRMRDEWSDRSPVGNTRRALSKVVGPDPDELVTPLGTPEHPLFWHEPRRDDTVVCPCGHFATLLCDEPIGKGRTCDNAICACCTVTVVGFDQCAFHAQTDPRQPGELPPPPPPHSGRPSLVLLRDNA